MYEKSSTWNLIQTIIIQNYYLHNWLEVGWSPTIIMIQSSNSQIISLSLSCLFFFMDDSNYHLDARTPLLYLFASTRLSSMKPSQHRHVIQLILWTPFKSHGGVIGIGNIVTILFSIITLMLIIISRHCMKIECHDHNIIQDDELFFVIFNYTLMIF